MFKDLLLVVLVSVVWSSTHATYFFDGNDDYGFYSGSGLDSYLSPLYQGHLDDYNDHNGGIVLSHIHRSHNSFIPKSINPFQRSYSDSVGFREPNNYQGLTFVTSIQNNPNKQPYHTSRINQEQIEIQSDNFRNNQPQIKAKNSNQEPQIQQQLVYSGDEIKQEPEKVNDYPPSNKQIEAVNKDTKKMKYENTFQSKIEDFNRQQYVSSGFKPMYESGSVKNVNSQNSYPDTQQNGQQGGYQNQEINKINNTEYQKNLDINYNVPFHQGYQEIQSAAPVIFNQDSLKLSRFLGIPLEVSQEHSAISDNSRPSVGVYHLHVVDGIGYLPSGGQIALGHGNQILHNINGEALYRIEGNEDHNNLGNIKLSLSEFLQNQALNNGSEYETTKDSSSEEYLNGNSDNYQGNIEQKSVEVGLKSAPIQQNIYNNLGDSEAEYKNIGSFQMSNSYGMTESPALNVGQELIEIGLKTSSGEKKSYNSMEDTNQYKVTDSPIIPTYTESKPLSDTVEQKSVDVDLKSSSGGYKAPSSYDSQSKSKDDSKYPSARGKDYGSSIEQKSVDVNIKSSSSQTNSYDNTASGAEYDGIGSIDAPKYPTLNEAKSVQKVEQKLEQKLEEVKSYQEIKSSIKSSEDSSVSDFPVLIAKGISDSKINMENYDDKNDESRNLANQKPSFVHESKLGESRQYTAGGVSTSIGYRNSGGRSPGNRDTYSTGRSFPNSVLNYSKYPDASNPTPSSAGNNYFTSRGSTLKHSNNNYFGPENSRSESNYQRPSTSIRPALYSSNFKRPTSSSQSYLSPIGSRPPIKAINRRFPAQQSSYRGIGETSTSYSGNRNNPFPSSIPKYHESVSSRISSPIYSDRRQPSNSYSSGFSPVTNLHTPTTPRYTVSHAQTNRLNMYPSATSVSYLERENSGIPKIGTNHNKYNSEGIPSSVDYSTGIGGSEYPGIGESNLPKSANAENKPYVRPFKPKSVMIEQKPYNDKAEITSSSILDETHKSPVEEYSGIGEAGSAPLSKSEIVGGKYPQKRPIKSTKKGESNLSGVKGKTEAKSPSKYLPITAALSGSSKYPDPQVKQHGATKSTEVKEPEKIEQQELVYEGLLAGPGGQSNAVGSSGFGFNRSPAVNTGYVDRPGSAGDKDENLPPMPYEFEFEIEDDEHGSEQYRQEKMDDNGFLTGRYGFKDAEGIFRQVEYEASKDGFKVNRIRTNEPGTDNENPADVHFEVQKQR